MTQNNSFHDVATATAAEIIYDRVDAEKPNMDQSINLMLIQLKTI